MECTPPPPPAKGLGEGVVGGPENKRGFGDQTLKFEMWDSLSEVEGSTPLCMQITTVVLMLLLFKLRGIFLCLKKF